MSSAKTLKLGLHKWESDDYVLREEFNDNFASIDKHAEEVTSQLAQTMNYLSDFGINVKTNVAIGDGVTDDLAVFEFCVNSLPTNGGTIYVPDGTYLNSNSWMIKKDNVTVICSDKRKADFFTGRECS